MASKTKGSTSWRKRTRARRVSGISRTRKPRRRCWRTRSATYCSNRRLMRRRRHTSRARPSPIRSCEKKVTRPSASTRRAAGLPMSCSSTAQASGASAGAQGSPQAAGARGSAHRRAPPRPGAGRRGPRSCGRRRRGGGRRLPDPAARRDLGQGGVERAQVGQAADRRGGVGRPSRIESSCSSRSGLTAARPGAAARAARRAAGRRREIELVAQPCEPHDAHRIVVEGAGAARGEAPGTQVGQTAAGIDEVGRRAPSGRARAFTVKSRARRSPSMSAARSGATSMWPPSQATRQAGNRSENESAAAQRAGQRAGEGLGVAVDREVDVVAEAVEQAVAHGAADEPGLPPWRPGRRRRRWRGRRARPNAVRRVGGDRRAARAA